MSRFQNYSDPDDNPGFRRDWGGGPTLIRFRYEEPDPAKKITKTEDSKAAEPKAAA